MKQVLARSGKVVVADIPAPHAPDGGVLVRVARSCVAAGVEGARNSPAPRLGGVLGGPERWRELARSVLDRGLAETADAMRQGAHAGQPLGFSLAGWIAEVGAGVADLRPGDRVACAGAGLAAHAEFAALPHTQVVPIPSAIDFDAAATVALGALALHGVRRLEPVLGETFVVLGLESLGQLATQMLRANGCRVIATDADARRVDLARQLGAEVALIPGAETVAAAQRMTADRGADGVLITSAGASAEIASLAFRLCRPGARVVLVGDVGLNLQGRLHEKELEFRIAAAPTACRDLEEYLRLVAAGAVRVAPLIAGVYPIQEAPAAYAALAASARPVVLLSYAAQEVSTAPTRSIPVRPPRAVSGVLRAAVVGAGAFARTVQLPSLKRLAEFSLRTVMSRDGVTARNAAEQFGASYATTDYDAVLADDDVDAVLICTRHHLHADMTIAALRAGKHVLVEAPLALNAGELARIETFYADAAAAGITVPILMTGYNRRFSPYAERIRAQLADRIEPAMLVYRMNAGHLPQGHWLHGGEGGGRNIGEAAHIYDLFLHLIDVPVERVHAATIRPATGYYGTRDNFTATVHFADGSLATLVFTSLGHEQLGQEQLEAFAEGTAAVMRDYRRLEFHGARRGGLRSRRPETGRRDALRAFARVILDGGGWPIPFEHQLSAARMSFKVEEALGR